MSRDLQFLAVALSARALAEACPEHPSDLPTGSALEDPGGAAARAALQVVAQARKRPDRRQGRRRDDLPEA